MRWLTTDRVYCLDCRELGQVRSRWFSEGHAPRCPHCGSRAVERRNTPLRVLRDVLVITNGA